MAERLLARPVFDTRELPPYQPYEIHPRAFTAKQCDRIIALGESVAEDTALLEGTNGEEIADGSIRQSRTAWISPDDANWWLFEKLAQLAERANRRYGFDLTGFGEDLQFTTYGSPGDFYTWHQDGLDGGVANRKLTIVIQLTEPETYAGGELQFFEVVEDYEDDQLEAFTHLSRQRGTAVIFPSFEYHRVLSMREGLRQSLVAWVSGPPFR
jgi:PKHD-type hydroxylase